MKPIEKYQQKFIELLKEAEEELGGNLCASVTSTQEKVESPGNVMCPTIFKTVYHCRISTLMTSCYETRRQGVGV